MRPAPPPRRSNRNTGDVPNATKPANVTSSKEPIPKGSTARSDYSIGEQEEYTTAFLRDTEFPHVELDTRMGLGLGLIIVLTKSKLLNHK